MYGQTTKICDFFSKCSRAILKTSLLSRFPPERTFELIFFLPGGISLIIESSRSPYIARAVVLGIGVAVITN